MAKIEFFHDEALNETYVTLLMLLVEADMPIFFDPMGWPLNEREGKRQERKENAYRELIKLGFWDENGRYVNSENEAYRAAQRWFEAERLGV